MTIQDKNTLGQKIAIKFGSKTPVLSPVTKLKDFLNVNPNNSSEISNFCQKYKFMPPGAIKDWYPNFIEHQMKLRRIVTKAIENKLDGKDLAEINSHLEGICPQVSFMTKNELIKVNKAISHTGEQIIEQKEQNLVIFKKHSSILVSLWEDFVNFVVSLQPLRVCNNCGQFFSPVERTYKKQRFCNELCRDAYHKRKKYHKSKLP